MEIFVERKLQNKVYSLTYKNYNIHIINSKLSQQEKEDIIKNIGGDDNSLYHQNKNRELEGYNIRREESINRKVPEEVENFSYKK